MRTVDLKLPGAEGGLTKASALGLGCASMMGRAGRRESLAALTAAYDAGITFYDTAARSYGYGACEGLLLASSFRARARDSVVLCTKFGILPGNPTGWKNRIKPLARAVLNAAPHLRGVVRTHAASQLTSGQFSVSTLESSVETSLRELKTDHADILLMHSPSLSTLQQDSLLEAMDRLVAVGKARLVGVSADGDVIGSILSEHSPILKAAQFPLHPFSKTLTQNTLEAAKTLFLIANQPFGGTLGVARCRSEVERMQQDSRFPQSLREKLDVRDETLLPELVLNCTLHGTGISVVVSSMLEPKHLRTNIRAVGQCRFSSSELQLIRSSFAWRTGVR